MKVTVKTPNVTQYQFVFEPEDPGYHRCTWADINLDHDTYTLTANTDCGSYTYAWKPTPNSESFNHLMARINGDYLLGKVSDESVFKFEESKRQLIKQAKDCSCTLKQDWEVEELEDLEECGEEMYLYRAAEITGIEYACIPVVKEFPPGAVTFAKIFTEYLQPLLREVEA